MNWQRTANSWHHWRDDFLLKRGIKVLVIQLSGLALAFGGNLLLARLYGEQVYGAYSLLINWAGVLSVITMLGMDDLHYVRLPSLEWQQRRGSILRQLKWSLKVNVLVICFLALPFYILLNLNKLPSLRLYGYYINISLLMIAALTFYNNLVAALRSLDKVVRGEVVDKLIRPFLYLALIVIFFYCWKKDLLRAAIVSNVSSLFVCSALLWWLVRRKIRHLPGGELAEEKPFSWGPNIRYTVLTLLYLLSVRLDILLLGSMAGPAEVGHYNAAIKFADILSYPIIIANLSLPALFARQRHENDGEAAPGRVSEVAKSLFFQCLLLGLLLLPAGEWILGWYGKGFREAFPVLCIFFLSGLATAAAGCIDTFFIMEGQESKVIGCRVISILLIAALALFLIPRWGIIGAAMATLAGNLVYCSLLEFFFYRKYGIFIHPFTRRKA